MKTGHSSWPSFQNKGSRYAGLEAPQIAARASYETKIVERVCDIEAFWRKFFFDGQRLMVIFLSFIQITTLPGDQTKVIEAHRHIEAAGHKFLLDCQSLTVVFFGPVQIAPPPRR